MFLSAHFFHLKIEHVLPVCKWVIRVGSRAQTNPKVADDIGSMISLLRHVFLYLFPDGIGSLTGRYWIGSEWVFWACTDRLDFHLECVFPNINFLDSSNQWRCRTNTGVKRRAAVVVEEEAMTDQVVCLWQHIPSYSQGALWSNVHPMAGWGWGTWGALEVAARWWYGNHTGPRFHQQP